MFCPHHILVFIVPCIQKHGISFILSPIEINYDNIQFSPHSKTHTQYEQTKTKANFCRLLCSAGTRFASIDHLGIIFFLSSCYRSLNGNNLQHNVYIHYTTSTYNIWCRWMCIILCLFFLSSIFCAFFDGLAFSHPCSIGVDDIVYLFMAYP